MRRRDFHLALPIAALASLAFSGAALADPPAKADGQYVDLAPAALPVVVDNRVINYIFVTVRINLTPGADTPHLRDKEPFFRDALVRAGHRTPFTRFDDYTRLDDRALAASLYRDASAIAGPGQVASVAVLSETPKQRTGLPKTKIPPAH